MSAVVQERPVEQEPHGWNEESRALGRKIGSQAVSANATHLRDLWADHIVKMLIDGYTYSRTWPTRSSLIHGLRAFNLDHRYKGKGGGQIKADTISRWLSEELLIELQVKAIDDLIAAERVKHQ